MRASSYDYDKTVNKTVIRGLVRYNVEHNFTNNCNDTRAEKYSTGTVLYCTVLVASCNQLLVKTALIIAAYYKAYIYDKFYECCISNVRVVLRLITVVQFQIANCLNV